MSKCNTKCNAECNAKSSDGFECAITSGELKPSDVILEGIRILRDNGWCQKRFFHGKASCAVGSIQRQRWVSDEVAEKAQEYMSLFVDQHTDEKRTSVFNDVPGRTAGEVAQMMFLAAKMAREAGE